MNNKLLCNILKLQYATFSAVNGKEAVDYVEREPFDAVLMDIQVCERTCILINKHIQLYIRHSLNQQNATFSAPSEVYLSIFTNHI